jgi:sec-independent protein translocase protein TatA
MGIGSNQILLILLVGALVFGASKLPQIGDGMGKAIRNFKKSVNDVNAEVEDITPRKEIDDKKDA